MLSLVFSLVKLQWLQELLLLPMLPASQLRSWPDTVSRHLAPMFHKVMGRNGIPRELLKEKTKAAKRGNGITHLSAQQLMSGLGF